MRYKAPRITDVVVGLLLILDFYTMELDGVRDTVNIFIFPYLSFSASSEATLVAR